jgi:2-polyprenyl-3-methyl-5-hydroxy-6-metoxy-1,4-benzoquinol methylase
VSSEPSSDDARLDEQMSSVREAVAQQLGVERPEHAKVDPADCERFADDLPAELSPDRTAELYARADALQPWLQGPFWLGGDVVVGGSWRIDMRWRTLAPEVGEDLAGKRVLDVGSNAGYDPFMFKRRGADEVLACEPFEFIEQARFLESVYRTGVDFQPLGWQDLDPKQHGQFDLVHCHGVLYHELHPMAMLERLRSMVKPGGVFLLGSMMLAEPELSETARFVPGAFYGDATWWWVPGRLCLRWMLEAAGCVAHHEFGINDGPPGEFPVLNGYIRASPAY